MTTAATEALRRLEHALGKPRGDLASLAAWRWSVRQGMGAVRDVLMDEAHHAEDGWLAARGGSVTRERNTLLSRLSKLGPVVLESPDVDPIAGELTRLVADVRRHVQRLHDLVYDEVEMELGGSE